MTFNKKILTYGILLVVFIIALLPWLQQGVTGTDDYRHHATRLWIMQQEVKSMHFSEWSFTAYGGWPMFHFYHPMFYILSLPVAAVFNAVLALKISTILIYAICLFGTFFAVKKLFNDDDIALIASIAYFMSATFLIQATVSGALPRLLAMALVPITVASFILALSDKKWFIPCCILSTMLFLSHVSVAVPAFIICLIYMIYQSWIDKKILWRGLIIFGIVLLLSSAWLIPMLMEKEYANLGGTVAQSVSSPPLTSGFIRSFGNVDGVRSSYFGYSILTLLLIGLVCIKGANLYKVGLAASVLLYFNVFNILNVIPLMNTAITSSSGYFISILIFNMVILAAICVSSKKTWILYLILFIIVIDLVPGLNAFSYGWVSQPTENLYNPPALIDAWKWISLQNGNFVVFSAIGYSAEIYHGKQEFGGEWIGCPQCVMSATYNIRNQIYTNFMKGVKDDAQLGYFGTKFYVAPCQSALNNTLAYSNGAVCVYENEKFLPLIQSDASITNIKWKQDKVSFTTISDNATSVIVKINYFKPHWHAFIDGKEVTINQVYPEFMQIEVPSGVTNVSFDYRTNLLHIMSWIITLLTLIGLITFERFIKIDNLIYV